MRFARNDADRDRIFALRFEVFALELGEALPGAYTTRRDADPFDAQCDHVMVDEISTGRCVGTYRMQTPEMARAGRGFYSATEFDLSAIPPATLDGCVELGRACVARDSRNKSVLFLLWRGLGAYLLWNAKRSFFGCSSLTSQDPSEGNALWAKIERAGHVSRSVTARPLPGFECLGAAAKRDVEVPKLFSIYLRHGAVVLGSPAIDREFGTIDFLTLLDARAMPPRLFELFTNGLPRRGRAAEIAADVEPE